MDLKYAEDLENVDSSNFSPELQNKISMQFLQYFLTQQLENSLSKHRERICQAMIETGNEIFRSPFHSQSLIKIDGDIVSKLKCREVGVSLRIGKPSYPEKCYLQFFLAQTYDSRKGDSK